MSSAHWDLIIAGVLAIVILLTVRYARTHPKVPRE